MEALGEMLIVTPYIEQKTGGFEISEDIKRADRGIIVDIGPDVILPGIGKRGHLIIGDKVTFNEHAGKNFEENGDKYILLRLAELYAKI